VDLGRAAVSWYLPKEWVDHEDGIEGVLIHYTFSPSGGWPDWDAQHNSRVLTDLGGFPRRRGKVLSMPRRVWDGVLGGPNPEFRLHYYFEVFQSGSAWTTDLVSEDILSREFDYVDHEGWITNICVYWGVHDWTAPVYSTMEDPRFPADSDFTSDRYYSYWDKDRFHYEKWRMLNEIPTPHVWRSRVWAPRGAAIVQQYHIGRMFPPEDQYETWLGPDGPSEAGGNYWVHVL
jgi:hypothetical protein